MELQAPQDATRLGRGEGLVEGARRVGRQSVEYNEDQLRLGVDEVARAFGTVTGGAAVGDLDGAQRQVGVEHNVQISGAVAAILADAGRCSKASAWSNG